MHLLWVVYVTPRKICHDVSISDILSDFLRWIARELINKSGVMFRVEVVELVDVLIMFLILSYVWVS